MKHIFALIGVTISLIAYALYLWQTITKKIKPHPFSWFVLTLTISTNGLLVLFNGGGQGSWPDFASATIALLVVGFSLRNYKTSEFSRSDVACLIASLLTYVLWLIIGSPNAAIILLTITNIVAMIPTFRKTWRDPNSETALLWGIFVIGNIFTLAAMAEYNLVTLADTIAWQVMDVLMVVIIFWRRSVLKKTKKTQDNN